MLEEHILKQLQFHHGVTYKTIQGTDSSLIVTYEHGQHQGCFTLKVGRMPGGLSLVSVRFSDSTDHLLLMSSAADTIAKLITAYSQP